MINPYAAQDRIAAAREEEDHWFSIFVEENDLPFTTEEDQDAAKIAYADHLQDRAEESIG